MNETSCIILGRDCLRHGVLITHITIPVVQLCELRNAVVSERQRFNQMVNRQTKHRHTVVCDGGWWT
jgi:hypothetical protein